MTARTIAVLVTFERPDHLARSLDLIRRQTRPPDRLIVIDNAPSSLNRKTVAGYSDVEYVPMKENVGPAGGVAHGQQLAMDGADDDDWMILFDDDDPPRDPTVLGVLVSDAVREREENTALAGIGLAGARLSRLGRLRAPSSSELAGRSLAFVDYLGGNQLPHYRIGAVRHVGTFRTDLFFGLEEFEFGLRMRAAGFTLAAHSALLLESRAYWSGVHTGETATPAWREYYTARNGLRVLLDHHRPLAAGGFAIRQLLGPALHVRPRAMAYRATRTRVRGLSDGLRHRMGRTVAPVG